MAKKTTSSNSNSGTVGSNVAWVVDGDLLTLTIDLSEEQGDSRSGKTTIIASTEGNKTIADVRVGLNVYRYKEAKKAKKGK